MRSFIFPESSCASSGVSIFLELFASLSQPWPERSSLRGEDGVYSPWYQDKPLRWGCDWQTSRGTGSVCNGDICPLGARLIQAPHFTEVREELTSGNNFQSLQMRAMVEPVTYWFWSKYQNCITDPFAIPFGLIWKFSKRTFFPSLYTILANFPL